MAEELLALVDAGTIRLVDILILAKDEDGAVEAMELSDIERTGRARRPSKPNSQNSWPKTTSSTSPPRWSPAAPPAC